VDERWLSVDEIATYLGVSRDTVYKWISRKGLPGHKVGKLWKFNTGEVDGWVRSGGATDARTRDEDSERGDSGS
jgi:excisionase family DNA binding protein